MGYHPNQMTKHQKIPVCVKPTTDGQIEWELIFPPVGVWEETFRVALDQAIRDRLAAGSLEREGEVLEVEVGPSPAQNEGERGRTR